MNKEQIDAMLKDIRQLLLIALNQQRSATVADDLYDALETIVEHHVTAAVRNQPIPN